MACASTASLVQNWLITKSQLKNSSVTEIKALMNMNVCTQKEGSVYGQIYMLESSCSMALGKTYTATIFTADIV